MSAIGERERATLVLIGHGTERNAQSGRIVRRLVARLRPRSGFGCVDCAFLDEEPRIAGVVERAASPHVVLVPFLVSDGWHTRETIPQALGLRGARTERDGRVLWYTRPVGTLPAVARAVNVATELARFRHPGVEIRVVQPSAPLRLRPLDFDGPRLRSLLDLGRRDGLACLDGLGYRP